MPFTFSHPAAVLPFAYIPKRLVSMTGMIIGSTAPDFEYFIRMRDRSYYSHTWAGMFYFDLPLCIMLAFIFHAIVRNPLIDNMPGFLSKRLQSFKQFDWALHFRENIPVVLISIIIGTASHIIWDKFTHGNSETSAAWFPFLLKTFHLGNMKLAVYDVLQHLSSIAGALLIFYAVMKIPVQPYISKPMSTMVWFWFMVGVMSLPVFVIRILTKNYHHNRDDIIMLMITAGLSGLVFASLLFGRKPVPHSATGQT